MAKPALGQIHEQILALLKEHPEGISEGEMRVALRIHPFSSHTRNIRETGAMRVDDALLPPKPYDITTDRPAGESGCTECDCHQWQRAAH